MHAGGPQRPSNRRKTLQSLGLAAAALSLTATAVATPADAPPPLCTAATVARAPARLKHAQLDLAIGRGINFIDTARRCVAR